MKTRYTVFMIAALVLLIVLVLSTSGCQLLSDLTQTSPTSTAPAAVATTKGTSPGISGTVQPSGRSGLPPFVAGEGLSVREVAEKIKPAVVQITNEQVGLDMFNRPVPEQAGIGSGVIYDQRGYILTNHHVVAGAQSLLVSLPDGRSFKGKLVGSDPDTDLAVVLIKGDNLPVAELGDSAQLQVGDWLVAIGNALALPGGPTVTAGVVSAVGRAIQEPASSYGQPGPFLYDLIQTDAAINPGNSGGALCNMRGQVIGINTLVAGMAEPGVQAQGIGFAIAINTAKPIADQLVATGRVVHPYLGIYYVPLNPSIVAQLGLSVKEGVIILRVMPGSPAEKAGLKVRDIVVAIDGQKLVSESTFGQIISKHKPGDVVKLSIVRGTQHLTVDVTLGEKPTS